MKNYFDAVPEVIKEVKQGKPVIVLDDASREGEGDFLVSASKLNPHILDFIVSVGRGAYICLVMERKRLLELDIPPAISADKNNAFYKTAFMCSIDAKEGVKSGSSFYDRTKTILAVCNKKTKPSDLVRPGHIIPLMAQEGGLLVRRGHTEAAMDLVKLANHYPAAVDFEIVGYTGHMANEEELFWIARTYNVKITKIEDIVNYIRGNNINLYK